MTIAEFNAPTDISQSQEIFSVSRLNREVRLLLEGSFTTLWIEGEISNFVCPQSGHWYFSLKDASAQVRCAMFKPQNRRLTFTPRDGMHVIVKARVTMYEGRGDYQLLVEHMEDEGVGRLQREFEALKKRLSAAGLFDAAHKKSLPRLPKTIGIITSSTGAAIRDILHVLKRRYAHARIIIYPTLVQGELAAGNIVNALACANERKECDVLILARGGGSIEDLWPFNEEKVAYAVYNCDIPIITGVGHEIDFTIADFVADVRAPTPSAAAETVSPDCNELLATLNHLHKSLARAMQKYIQHLKQVLQWTVKQIQQQHPQKRLLEKTQRLDSYQLNLIRLNEKLLTNLQKKLMTLRAELLRITPLYQIRHIQQALTLQQQKLQNQILTILSEHKQRFINATTQLNALNPLATLNRGYAIAYTPDHKVLRHVNQVNEDDNITVQLQEGQLECIVLKIDNDRRIL